MKQATKQVKQKSRYSSIRVSPKHIEEVVMELKDIGSKGGLTPENVLQRAKNPSNLLHRYFTWDNNKAGEAWRKHQARFLISTIKIKVSNQEISAFENVKVNITTHDNKIVQEREYIDVVEVFSDVNLKNQIVNNAIQEINYWQNKYKALTELNPIFEAIEKVEENLDG